MEQDPEAFEVVAPGGRRVRGWRSGPADGPVVFWHGGTPNTGEPPVEPLREASAALGIRWLGADRPGYGGSDPLPGTSVADVVQDVALIADHEGVRRFAVLGHSGGGPRAIATAALLGDRVTRAAAVASPAPPAPGFDRAACASPGIAAMQHAAARGRAAVEHELATAEFDPGMFTAEDFAALDGPWGWFLRVVQEATAPGPEGQVSDELAQHGDWGFALDAIRVPVLLVHGSADRTVPVEHGRRLAAAIPGASLQVIDGAGHLSVLDVIAPVLRRLVT